MIRIRYLYTGNVQGVGFRETATQISLRHAVTGYVHNLPDGRVEVVAEGELAAIETFAAAVAERMRGNIVSVERLATEATGEFDAFAVRRW